MQDEFISTLKSHAHAYGVAFDDRTIARLAAYYEVVNRWNARLHLVAPCAPAEFATRHVLESLLALRELKTGWHFIDIGSGAGLPAIPCLLTRSDLKATLIEASTKKSIFLREAINRLDLRDRAEVINARFEKTSAPDHDAVTCRALERFTEQFASIVCWSPPRATLLFFGGNTLREVIEANKDVYYENVHAPQSEQRFLFIIKRAATNLSDRV